MKIMISLSLFFIITSCNSSNLAHKVKENCLINEGRIEIILNDKKINIKDFFVRYSSDSSLMKNCEGLFFIEVLEWKGLKNSFNNVAIPVLVVNDSYFINDKSFINADKKQQEIIGIEFQHFYNQCKDKFNSKDFKEIERAYKKGIIIHYRGYY